MTIINSVIIGGGDTVQAFALSDAKNVIKDDKIVLNENNIDENPIPYKYLAKLPVNNVFTANKTLTGFVRKNDGGLLTVSTVEDPNNPPPVVPDEAGLKTEINYGGPIAKNNYTIIGSPTISGTTVTNFASNKYVYSNVTVGGSSGIIEYYTAFTIKDMSAIGSRKWNPIIDTIPYSTQKGMTLNIEKDKKTLNLSSRSSSSTYVNAGGSLVLVEGVKYFVKAVYDGSTWKTYLSTSGHYAYNPFEPDGEVACSFYPTQQILTVGRDTVFGGGYNLGSSVEIDLAETKVVVNGVVQWVGAGTKFGSVQVGYGYFRNTLTKPSDKYISYNGGLLTEDNIQGSKATTMNIILGRSEDMGSWTSDTEGYLTAQDSVVLGINKKLSTPVYLWHDLSYITPAVPETIEPDVTIGGSGDYVVVGSLVINSGIASGFSANNYITPNTSVGSTNNATYKVRFRVDAIGLKGPIMHYEGLFGLNIDESGKLYDWNWSNSAAVNICTTTAGHTYTARVNINGTTRSWTITDETTGETFTTSLTDRNTVADSSVVLTYGRSSSPTATTYFNGSIYLDGCSVNIGGTIVWAAITTGTVSLSPSWKNVDGVLYEYPDGLPKAHVSDLSANIIEGYNTLYATRTGNTCGLVISATTPTGVNSSAVIGTVVLDTNGTITNYTTDETLPASTTIYINNKDVSNQCEVIRLPDGSGYAAKVPNTATYRRYEVDSFSESMYWGVGIDPSNIQMTLRGDEVSFSELTTPSEYLYVVNSDSLNGVRRPYEGDLIITDRNYDPAG